MNVAGCYRSRTCMRLASLVVASIVAVGGLASCSDSVSEVCASDDDCRGDRICFRGSCAESSTEESSTCQGGTIDGESACTYYEQFTRGETDTFVGGYGVFGGDARGGFRFRIFLETSGDAVALYDEGRLGHGYRPYEEDDDRSAKRTRIETSWRVDGTELVIGEVLRCQGEAYCDAEGCSEEQRDDPEWENRQVLECTVERAVGRQEAVGESVTLETGGLDNQESAAPDDPQFADYAAE